MKNHLGSSSWITGKNGEPVQFIKYLPYGETQVSEASSSIRYTFSGKEKDQETGYSYFGARYYWDDLSIWLSVDPLADEYPHVSPYMYCLGSPINLIDPDGRKVYDWNIFVKQNGKAVNGFASSIAKERFNKLFYPMYQKNEMFRTIYKQLAASNEYYSIFQNYAWSRSAGASYSSEDRKLQFYKSIGGGDIFEEFFHAGQHEFYGTTLYKNKGVLSKEFEAKIARIYSAFTTNNPGLLEDDGVLGKTTQSDMNIIVQSLKGENVNSADLNAAFKNLQQNIIDVYDLKKDTKLDVNNSLKYLKSLIKNK